MQYMKQLGIILIISFLGEIFNFLIPLPIPASIYGLILMFICLKSGFIHLSSVKETGTFLIEILPFMFLPAAVGLMTSWDILKPVLIPYAVITFVSTILVMLAAGHTTQALIRFHRKEKQN